MRPASHHPEAEQKRKEGDRWDRVDISYDDALAELLALNLANVR